MLLRTAAPIIAIAAAATMGCSLLAPSDEELMPPTPGSGAAGSAGSVTSSGGGLAGIGGGTGFCGVRAQEDPTARFCEDFDEGDGVLGPETWTAPGGDPDGSAELVSDPHASSPNAAEVRLDQPDGCFHALLSRNVFGTVADAQEPPHQLHLHMALGANEDGFFGRMELADCVVIVTVHGGGTSVGFEFQWGDGTAYVDYPVDASIFGRIPRIQWDVDLQAGTTGVAVDGQALVPVEQFEVPSQCRVPVVPMQFAVGLACQDAGTVVIDDVVYGTN